MSRSAALAAACVRRWVCLYTAGVEPQARDQRRAEMDSDLWENLSRPDDRISPATEIIVRALLGSPADLSWRLEQTQVFERLTSLLLAVLSAIEAGGVWVVRHGLPGLTTLLAWVYIAGGVLLLVAAPFQDAKLAAFALLGGWAILGGLAVRWGHAAISTRPLAGFGGVLFGAVPLGLVLSASVLAPVFAVVVGFVEGRRAWMLRRAMKREGPYYSRYW